MKGCIILANGYIPKKRDIVYLRKNGYKYFICADGGANSAKKLNMIPDIIIGDLDSITAESLQHYKKKRVIIKKITRQNDTDVEKCIKYAVGKKFTDIVLLGATGDRLDHTFCNIGIALKFNKDIAVKILHEKSFMKVISGQVILDTLPGEAISIYGIDSKTKFTSIGLKYPLKNVALPFGVKESTSNVALSGKVELKIKNGQALIVRDFEVIKDNDFIF